MAAVRIENRAQLVYLLTEAAELEHGIMCCYLFANFSLKDSTSEGVSEEQLKAIRRWRGLIREIAIQEMVHLGLACNLLTAVGGAPQLRRANLPVSPKAYDNTFRLQLKPFSMEVLQQFIDIEQPESLREEKVPEQAATGFGNLSDIFSSERQYNTQGGLYHGIEDGLLYLAQKLGEDRLFIGPPAAQTADSYFYLQGLTPVYDLESAKVAIDVIITQGEGATVESLDSHYAKFMIIQREYEDILRRDPSFVPARPVLTNPYATIPGDKLGSADISIVDHPMTTDVCNLFDGCYELMVQILGRLFVHAEETEAEFQDLSRTGARLMLDVLAPLGNAITLMPAGPSNPGKTAGPSFRLSKGAIIPTQRGAARIIFSERLAELAAYTRFLQGQRGAPAVLTQVREALQEFSEQFAKG